MNRKQKSYYKAKLRGFQRMLWDLELQRYTNGILKEQTREEYDQVLSRKEALVNQEAPKGQNKEFNEGKEKILKELEEKVKNLQEEMDLFDAILFGRDATEKSGYIEGINTKIDTVRSTMQKTKDYINGRR